MRITRERSRFKQDFKRESRGRYRNILRPGGELWYVIDNLKYDIPLPEQYHDHPLHNNLEGLRECHLRSDFLLVYKYEGDDWLILERLGTHSEIFGL
ncbi:MAG: type II toxin-antitoxin system YafQ family toxin [Synergistaceae bacterium]|nr:type II toxin-antitoxin system YafQ family toxin [Synergistaceae bacterium]